MNLESKKFGVSEAMESLAKGKSWVLKNDDYDTLEWFELDSLPPTKEEVKQEILNLHIRAEQEIAQKEEEKKQQEKAKLSALQKLSKLGLTEEEAKAIVGL